MCSQLLISVSDTTTIAGEITERPYQRLKYLFVVRQTTVQYHIPGDPAYCPFRAIVKPK